LLALFALLAGCLELSALPDRFTELGGGDTVSSSDTEPREADNGDACDQGSDCNSGRCENDVCCQGPGDCCASDAVCGGGYACDLVSFSCRASCKSSGVDQDAWCRGGYHCDANTCFEDIAIGPCDEPSDCGNGECLASYCCEHAGLCCAADHDCPELFDGCATDNTRTCVFSVRALPDTNQTQCRDVSGAATECGDISSTMDYYGQDGHYPRQARSFTAVDENRVRDEVTGLIWAKSIGSASRWSEAETTCASLELGLKAYRLPTRFELLSLLDFGSQSTVGLPAQLGAASDTTLLWTSTELAGEESSTAWAVDAQAGTMMRVSKDSVLPRALCVEVAP
jgi:hypothetical protein